MKITIDELKPYWNHEDDILEAMENWREGEDIILIEENGDDYRDNFWNYFSFVLDDDALGIIFPE
jgi:hypothetical protein